MKKRGFEIVSAYLDEGLTLPERATKHAAGYDIRAARDITIPSFWKQAVNYVLHGDATQNFKAAALTPTLVPTGLKAYMLEDEYVQITCRSSNPLKRGLVLPNGVGIVDKDYYNNPGNEGHIFVQLLNFGLFDVHIKKGERIAQCLFLKFLTVDHDDTSRSKDRSGGFGSSGQV